MADSNAKGNVDRKRAKKTTRSITKCVHYKFQYQMVTDISENMAINHYAGIQCCRVQNIDFSLFKKWKNLC